MDFDLTEEHRIFQKAIRDFSEKEIAPMVEEAEATECFPVQLFPRLGELGYLGVRFPAEYGGADADKVAECIYIEELCRVCAGIAGSLLAHTTLGCTPIYLFGSEQQKEKYLLPALRGEKIASFGLTEPNAGSDAASLKTRAVRDGDFYILNGTKMFITNGSICDFVIVAAYTDPSRRGAGISLFIVEKGTPGFKVWRKLEKVGNRSSDTAELVFEDCRVPKENLLGEREGGFNQVVETLVGGRITYGARCVGVAQAAYDASFKYAQERVQFGQPISKLQAIKFKLVRMAMEIDAARIITYRAAWLFDSGRPYKKEASMVKLFATEMVQRVTSEAMQIHGGYGYIMEYPVQRYFRDARLFSVTEGTSEVQQLIIGKELGL